MDRTLSREVLEFVRARNAFSTPAEIYRDLLVAQPSGWEFSTSQQVYYQWQQANSKNMATSPRSFSFSSKSAFLTTLAL
ncbi:hypothetical protein V1506DRAFT_547123, partial [Lipomyces tetrasporus]